jgi:hypothetical protein
MQGGGGGYAPSGAPSTGATPAAPSGQPDRLSNGPGEERTA